MQILAHKTSIQLLYYYVNHLSGLFGTSSLEGYESGSKLRIHDNKCQNQVTQ